MTTGVVWNNNKLLGSLNDFNFIYLSFPFPYIDTRSAPFGIVNWLTLLLSHASLVLIDLIHLVVLTFASFFSFLFSFFCVCLYVS